MLLPTSELDTHQKALTINLNNALYGTFAEIGAGQEIARWFFRVGGAAGTVAKSMSAYDMTVSDAIYGKSQRYVSRDRVLAMLQHEYGLLLERLAGERGKETTFFAFANTVSARNYRGTNECHGWMGLRFQTEPGGPPNDILLHVNMLDRENVDQQEALGVVGVNFIYGAFYDRENIDSFLSNLLDDLPVQRIEIDILEFTGPAFESVNNRKVALRLLELELSNAAIFAEDKNAAVLPSELVYKRPILMERGAYRALHQLNSQMVQSARTQLAEQASESKYDPVCLLELSVHDDRSTGPGQNDSHDELLSLVDQLSELGNRVMVSRFREFYPLTTYLRRYTAEPIGFVMGITTLARIMNERDYEGLSGRMLEGLGKLFSYGVNLFVYPMKRDSFRQVMDEVGLTSDSWVADDAQQVDIETLSPPPPLGTLFTFLKQSGLIKGLRSGK